MTFAGWHRGGESAGQRRRGTHWEPAEFGHRAQAAFRTLPAASAGPAPAGVSPPPVSFAWRAPPPLPLAGAGPRPPPLPSLRRRVPSPERPELRAAGGLLNRGGGVSRGGSGARSGDESAAPRVGGGGRTARDRLGGPHHGRTEGAAAEGSQGAPAGEWPASQRRAEGGGSPRRGTAAARGGKERRRPPGGLAGSASAGQPPLHPEPCLPLDCGPRHKTVLWGRGRTAAKFKRLNLTALADTAGRGGRGRGRAWIRVTWGWGGAWQASLLFWPARAQKAEHVVFLGHALSLPPPAPRKAEAAAPVLGVWGALWEAFRNAELGWPAATLISYLGPLWVWPLELFGVEGSVVVY